mmetsp:Transcript_77209/g.223448  ORF Transcript_77209/g.223448 Transcript_77209/m.223448 type:complete len:184 (-) Transcript_77209:121-672(-)
MNNSDDFVSLINAVNYTLRHKFNRSTGDKVYILGSEVTMDEKGEYMALFNEFRVNADIPETARGWLWTHTIKMVQNGEVAKASANFYKFLEDHQLDQRIPISLSCTELPIAAEYDPKMFANYTFLDPNLALAELLVMRAEQRVNQTAHEKYIGWKSGVHEYMKECCAGGPCDKCCEGFNCTAK